MKTCLAIMVLYTSSEHCILFKRHYSYGVCSFKMVNDACDWLITGRAWGRLEVYKKDEYVTGATDLWGLFSS